MSTIWNTWQAQVEDLPEDHYSYWTKEELQAELEKRDLPKSGNKAELVERLEDDDAA